MRQSLVLVLLASTQLARTASAQEDAGEVVSVVVKEVTADYAYIIPGYDRGIRVGQEVLIGGKTYRVLQVSKGTALIKLHGDEHTEGDRGSANVESHGAAVPVPLSLPKELSHFRGKWPAPVYPAREQPVEEVPLGSFVSDKTFDLTFMLQGSGLFDLKSESPALGRGQIRTRAHYQPISNWPLHLDADAAAQLWFSENLDDRASEDSRPLLRVRELQAGLGEPQDLYAALGRLRYTSRSLGMLDGVKAQAPIIGGLSIGAFGGLLPNPLDGKPNTEASRFGTELTFSANHSSWHPLIGISAYGSIYDGELDERRVSGDIELLPDFGRLAAQLELAFYDEDNIFMASPMEVNSAAADLSFYLGPFTLGGRAQMRRPERSLWLVSYLPLQWFCITQRTPTASLQESCSGDDMSYLFALDAGLDLDGIAFDASALLSEHSDADSSQIGSLLNMRLLPFIGPSRLDVSLMASTGSLFQTGALSLGFGVPLFDDILDLSLRYRPAISSYKANPDWFLEHTVGAALLVLFSQNLEFSLDADLLTDRDIDLFLIQSSLIWRL